MAIATTKLTTRWCFRELVRAFRVAQGRTMPFFGKDVDMKLKIT